MMIFYLIICRDKLSDGFQHSFSCKFAWPGYLFKSYYRLLRWFSYFFSLLLSPNTSRNCPVINRYAIFFTHLLIELPMLTKMPSTGGVTPNMKCFPPTPLSNKLFIIFVQTRY